MLRTFSVGGLDRLTEQENIFIPFKISEPHLRYLIPPSGAPPRHTLSLDQIAYPLAPQDTSSPQMSHTVTRHPATTFTLWLFLTIPISFYKNMLFSSSKAKFRQNRMLLVATGGSQRPRIWWQKYLSARWLIARLSVGKLPSMADRNAVC